MSKFLSGRQSKLKLGVSGYTESKTVLQTTGKVGIGTTDAQSYSLFVVGSTNISGDNSVGGDLSVTGTSSLTGNTTVGSAITMYASTGIISATQFYGDGSNLLNTGATLSAAAGTQRLIVSSLTSGTMVDAATDSDLTYNATTDTLNVDNLIVAGNLTVDGDQTILNVTQLEVEDINIGIASASTKLNNAQLDGAGITIHGSQGDKTLTWDNSNSRLGFNTDLYVPKVETAHAQITGGISTDGYDTGNSFELMRADGNGGWEWATVPGIFSVNNILNGFNVYEEGLVVGTAGSIHTLDFRGINVTATAAPQPNGIATVTFSTRPSFDETYITGLSTAGRLIVSGISTFNGEIDANGRIVAAATNNVIPFLYSNLGDLPSAVSFHGAFAHVHGTGKAYYAHAANWYELVNKDLNGTVGTGTERYNIGPVDLTTLDVSGISTFNGEIDANGRIVGAQLDNVIPFYYDNTSQFPSASTYHGAVAHAHNTGRLYFAHAGWKELVNAESNGVVGTGTETYNIGNIQITGTANVGSAITMYGSTGIVSATAFYGDGSNLLNTGATLSAASGVQRLVVTDLTSGTMVDAATDGDLTFTASNNTLTVPRINVSVGATFGGTITAGSSEGVVGQYLRHVGTGVTWANFPTLRTTTTIIATNGQTVFGFTHNTNFLDVFVNGVKLSSSEYSSNGSSVTLNVGSFAGDVVELHSYNTASTYGGGGGGGGGISLTDLSVATAGSPSQLGALAYNNSNGVFTFTPPDVQGQSRQALSVGTANNPLQVGAISYNNGTGVFTYTPPDLSSYVQTNSSASFSGIDVTGHIETDTLRVSGISTFQGNVNLLSDSGKFIAGAGGDLEIFHDGNDSGIRNNTGGLYLQNNGTIFIGDVGANEYSAKFHDNGATELYYDGTKKFETTNTGVTVTGTLAATAVTGSGSGLTGLTGASAATYGGASVSPQITVDANGRITNITNVSIAGGGGGGGSSIIIQDNQSLVGAAGTIDFGTGLSVSAISAGVATVTAAGITTHDVNTNSLNVVGVATATTFSGSGASLTTLNASELDSGTIPDARFPATLPAASGANLTNLPAANITGTLPAISGANLTNLDASDLASGTVPDARFPATLPAASGANLTTLNASELDSGTVPDARFPATLPAVSGANLTNLPSPTPADTDVQVTYDVSSNGSSAYRITGPGYSGADDNPDIYLVRGQRYRFINGTGSGHPFRIQSDTSGTAYTDGVSGSQNGTQDFNVQYDAPVRLYYQCTIHSGMIGNIYIVGGSDWRMSDVATNALPDIFTFNDVGIGTDNPNSLGKLSVVVPTTGGAGAINVQNHAQGTGLSNIVLRSLDNNGGNWADAEFRAEAFSFKIRTTERLRIDSSGNLTAVNTSSGGAVTLKIGANATSGANNGTIIINNGGTGDGALQFDYENSAARAKIYVYRSTQDLIFDTAGSEKLRIQSGGGISFNGDTAQANALDDYEEGTFTPEFANAASGGTESSSYTTQTGRYTKIGNLVHIDIYLKDVDTTGLGTGQFFIRGLPFSIKSGSIHIGAAGLSDVDLNSTASSLYAFANASGGALSAIRVFQTKDNTGHSAIPCDAVNDGDNEIFITMTYPTDS